MVEMLVVLAILTSLMAIGAGAFILTSRRLKSEAAADSVEVAIRQTRNSALSAGTPAFVEFQQRDGKARVIPWGYRLVGMWRFEESDRRLSGGFKNISFVHGAKQVEGKIGKGMALAYMSGAHGAKGFVECSADPAFDCEDGGYLEAYVFPEFDLPERQFVFRKKGCYSLAIEPDGLLAGRVGDKATQAESFQVPAHRWTKVALAWDRQSTRVMVDDAILGVGLGAKTPINDEPLIIGDGEFPLLGRVDEVKVMAAIRGNPIDLPQEVALTHTAQPWNALFFAPDGGLDLRYHLGPVTVELTQNEKRRTISVSMFGLTKRSAVERAQKPEPEAESTAQAAARKAAERPRPSPRPLLPARRPSSGSQAPPKPPAPPKASGPAAADVSGTPTPIRKSQRKEAQK
jgi:hypothetical protein